MLKSERRAIRNALVEDPNEAVGFVSKVICYRKNWQQNAANQAINNVHAEYDEEDDGDDDGEDFGPPILKTIWHRDISAAKLIMYRGMLFVQLKLLLEN